MRKGAHVEVRTTSLDADGAAIGSVGGLTIHIAGACPDERVEALIEYHSPHRPEAWATLLRVVEPSPARVTPACPAWGPCGGCRLEHLSYQAQLAWKTALVRDTLHLEVPACLPSPSPLGYRNREKRVYAEVQGRRVLGAYAPRTHQVIDLAGCRVSEPPLDEVAGALLPLLTAVAPYDESSGAGLCRYVLLRVNHAGRVLVVLVTASADFPDGEVIARALMAARPEVVGVVQNLNPTRGNALWGVVDRPLHGATTLDERVGEVRLQLSATAFFQVNRAVAARLYADALEAAALDGSERVIDVYCGVGGVALTLAPRAREILGIESHAASIDDARTSAGLSGASNARFEVGDAARRLEGERADVMILNPPRKGCSTEVIARVRAIAPRRLLYISCNPETLARDLQLLGYRVERAQPYDMLPQTPHVEVLATLTPP